MASNTEGTFGVCRTCLEPISKQSGLDAGISDCHRKLSTCFPELNLALTSNPAFCNTCEDAVNSSVKFKTLCYETEVKILKYLQQAGANITTANLAQIAKANRNESAVVDLHIKDIAEITHASGNYCMDNNCIQQHISNQLASTDDGSSHKSGEKVVTTKKCYRKGSGGGINVYRCHKCPYRSTYKLQLTTHIRIHLTKSGYHKLQLNYRRKKREKCNKTQKQSKITLTAFNKKHVDNLKLKYSRQKNFQCDSSSMKYSLKSDMKICSSEKPFSCDQCDFNTKYKQSLKRHLVTHTKKKFNYCMDNTLEDNCIQQNINNQIASTDDSSSHKSGEKVVTTKKSYRKGSSDDIDLYRCHKCPYRTTYKLQFTTHIRIHLTKSGYRRLRLNNQRKKREKCIKTQKQPKITLTTFNQKQVDNHKLKQSSEKDFHCDKNSKKSSLKSNMKIRSSEKPFSCDQCHFNTKYKQSLKRHLVNHTKEKFNYCMDNTLEDNCVQQNINIQIASTDDSSSHKSGEKVVTMKKRYRKGSSDDINLYRCHKCPYRTTYKLQFTTHIRIHLTKSGYRRLRLNNQRKKREKCNKTQKQPKITLTAFNQKHVDNHKLKYSREKNFPCDSSSTKHSLKSDMKIRSSEKPFSCDQCNFNTKYKQSLKKHLVTHTKEKFNYCMDNTLEDNCIQQNIKNQTASTNYSSSHKSGEKVVTTKKCYRKGSSDGIDLYRCHKCPYRTTYELQFSTHIRTHLTKSEYRRLRLNNQRKKRDKYNKTQKQPKITLTAFNQKHVDNHKLKQPSEKDFHCDKNSKKSSLKSNMKICSSEKPFSCDQCDFNTKYKQSLKRHLVTHTKEKFNYCMDNTLEDNCIQQNINNQIASTDDSSSHKSGEKVVTTKKRYRKGSSDDIDLYRCHKCPYRSTYKPQFSTHLRTHITKSGYRRLRLNNQRKKRREM